MLRRIVRLLLGLIGLAILVLAAGLTWAHLAIRRERAPLPAPEVLRAAAAAPGERPVRLTWINTATQPMPRAAVLADGRDPAPTAPYRMSHPSFVLEWSDGRLLLVDAGMTRDAAIEFGRPLETLGGAGPIAPHGSVAERLGAARDRVQGVVFTHLHVDHAGGIVALCAGRQAPIRAFMTGAQATHRNYTTRPGHRLLADAGCVERVWLESGPLRAVPDFPGVFVIAAGGHTPGSQIVVAHVGAREPQRYVFTGDIVNHVDGINHNLPKPFLYSLLLVPEDRPRLDELRRYLKWLRDDRGSTLLVSHDEMHIEASGVAPWEP
jgi:glyoxylase-like metal-dependent hydrolase (beta-lactamase superfamily II)